MHRRSFIVMAGSAMVFLAGKGNTTVPTEITVYKDPTCGCCHAWSKAMADAGYSVDMRDTDDLASVKAKLGVPTDMEGCHTAVVEDYYLEGHVPLEAVERLLQERPPLEGLAVPGMPPGSLGMGDDPKASYDIHAIPSGIGAPYVFMEIRPPKG
ncbi:DUF411 domain-containing protein [Rhizobium lentis]|uniref:DUF411 domain-containing protein n=1 Tax=Rhizobium lentis TaxID=1138194 RepID=UPI001C8338A0|nr:DUF411 domain-containing protein [Rhizobium lentis]MBX5132696.1 DUF411 domain-containing protein [Rhizobium lentis]